MVLSSCSFEYHASNPTYEFSVRAGSNLKQVAQQLEDDGVILNKWTFILLARYLKQESAIKAGDYLLNETVTQLALLNYLTSGDAKRNAVKFIEGWTFAQLRQVLDEHPLIKKLTADLDESEILRMIGATETAAEGIFFPIPTIFEGQQRYRDIATRLSHHAKAFTIRVGIARPAITINDTL